MSILDSIQGMLTPQLLGSLAAKTGIPEGKVKSGLTASSSAIMSGLADRAGDSRVMRDVAQLANQGGEVVEPSSFLDEDSPARRSGTQLIGHATEDPAGLIKRLSSSLGVGGGVASTLLGIAGSFVMSWLRKLGRSRGGFDADSMSSLLRDERSSLPAAGLGGARAAESATYREHHSKHPGKKNLWWLLALIPIALLAWWLFDRERPDTRSVRAPTAPRVEPRAQPAPKPETEVVPAPTPPPSTRSELEDTPRTYQAVPESSDATPPAANQDEPKSDSTMQSEQEQQPPAETQSEQEQSDEPMKDQSAQDQSDQTMQEQSEQETQSDQSMKDQSAQSEKALPEGSAEAQLQSQATGPSGAEGTTWIDLDEVEFEVNSADVPDSAKGQIENVAIVLQENPDVTIEIRGHASATGDAEHNKTLSEQRAENVRQALVDQGIESSRISVTASDEQAVESQGEEQANRRVSARIKSGEKDEG